MSGADSDLDRPDELTERYRAASAADPGHPSDSLRESIFAYARNIAADRVTRSMASGRERRRAANDPAWLTTAAASIVVAGLASVLAWHFRAPVRPSALEATPPTAQLAVPNPPAAEPPVSAQRSEHFLAVRPASPAPAPSARTTRAKGRAEAPSDARTAAADEAPYQALAGGMASSRQALAAAASPGAGAAPNSLLVAAAESGNLDSVDRLLRSGISTEQTDARGRTALLVATLHGDTTMVRRLLAAGAHPDAADHDGDTPLATARRQGPPDLARLLERASHP